jgi:hypothetical protein
MDSARAKRWVERYRAMFQLVPDPPSLLDRWADLIAQYQIKGFQVHDARYVAAMQCSGIGKLMTHNSKHFKVYGIALVDPAAL